MPARKRRTTDELLSLARRNLPTIANLWDKVGGVTIQALNEIRGLFNLVSQSEAATIWHEAKAFAWTPLGQNALGSFTPLTYADIPINPTLRSPFSTGERIRTTISFEFDGEYFSFNIWTIQPPTMNDLEQAVAEFLSENIDIYPFIDRAIHAGAMPPTDIRIRGAERVF